MVSDLLKLHEPLFERQQNFPLNQIIQAQRSINAIVLDTIQNKKVAAAIGFRHPRIPGLVPDACGIL